MGNVSKVLDLRGSGLSEQSPDRPFFVLGGVSVDVIRATPGASVKCVDFLHEANLVELVDVRLPLSPPSRATVSCPAARLELIVRRSGLSVHCV